MSESEVAKPHAKLVSFPHHSDHCVDDPDEDDHRPIVGSAQGDSSIVDMAAAQNAGQQNEASADEAVDIVVYFANNEGLHLRVVDGQNAKATELFEMVMDEQKYPHEARELFSLWLVSDLLELQLKPTHIPFKLVCYWEELLEKYSSASAFNRQRDEPVIAFKRNVFCTCTTEKQILDKNNTEVTQKQPLLSLLYNEAKKNILSGRYPISQKDCDKLAGLQAVISEKEGSRIPESDIERLDYFKKNIAEYLPTRFCKRHWILKTHENPEYRLLESYGARKADNAVQDLEDLYRSYLKLCWDLPYYGSAFFRGQVEHPGRRLLSSHIDDPVYVAINTNGVYVIDEDDFELLIGLPYKFLCWERGEADADRADECLPCLFLQFPVLSTPGQTKIFQIFSHEAILMDKLIEACIELKKKNQSAETREDDNLQIIKGYSDVAEKFERLSLVTFQNNRKLSGRSSVLMSRGSKRQAHV
jgi:hypothetical protein